MDFPITANLLTLEIKAVVLSDIEPVPSDGYEIVLLKDLVYTKLWLEFKVT